MNKILQTFILFAALIANSYVFSQSLEITVNVIDQSSIEVIASEGSAPYSYRLNDGSWQESNIFTGLTPGTYTISVQDNTDLEGSTTAIIEEPEPLIANVQPMDVICYGGSDGAIEIITFGGSPPYQYRLNGTSWIMPTDDVFVFPDLSAETYVVEVMDSYDQVSSAEVTINEPDPITLTTTQTNASCNGCNDGSATISASGGTAPYTYSWSPSGSTSSTASGLAAGSYNVTITDDNGCTAEESVTITEPALITGITFESGSFIYNGTEHSIIVNGTLPDGTSVSYDDNTRTDTGTQTVTATISGTNYETLILTAELEVTPAAITGITFENGSFVYDGTEHSITIDGTLPEGTLVTYSNNTRTDTGVQTATATITGANYQDLILTAELEVTPATITGIVFDNGSFVYNGTEHTIEINGTLPTGTIVSYDDNSLANVGSQTVTATVSGANYTNLALTANLEVTPATITGITFENGSFVYNGTEHVITVDGTLPEGTSVAYSDNARTDVGIQTATATITGVNYQDLILTTEIEVTPATITGIIFENGSFVYEGTEHSITIDGTLPEGTSVTYYDNARTNVGVQTATATITGANYQDLILTAELEVIPAIITGIVFENQSFVYNGTEHNISINGTLPEGTSVTYDDNTRTDTGTQTVTATISGTNYETLILTAELEVTPTAITGIAFENGSFVYDGTEHSITIDGSLPKGTSVMYSGNIKTDVGVQIATATITGTNYQDLILTAKLEVAPATITGITFENGSFVYDGTEHVITINGTLPEGTSVTYSENSRTDVGVQTATATITGANYHDLILTAELEIAPATITGITFENGSFVYDGTEHSIAINGILPQGTSVTYSENSRTDVGVQTATATITGANYHDLILTAELEIAPATITGITFENGSFVYDGTEHAITINGTLPEGTSVTYSGNVRTDVGVQTATATISGANYQDLILTAELEISSTPTKSIAIMVGDSVYQNPESEIYYQLTCDNSSTSVQVDIQTEIGANVAPGNRFNITTPAPGIYTQSVSVTSQDGTVKTYNITVEKNFSFDEIAIQKFNNILLINNNPNTNGGYEFTSYRWFKNNQFIGAGQYYSAGDNDTDQLDPNATYSVEMVTTSGETLKTCNFQPENKLNYSIKAYPNPVTNGKLLNINYDFPKKWK